MRSIYVEDGLTVSFPGRSEEFDHGVEVGIALTLMAAGENFTSWLSAENIEQAHELARKMNFQLVPLGSDGERRQVIFRKYAPVRLQLVAHKAHAPDR
jgi:hypothetical protein